MKIFKILMVMLILIMSVGAVCAAEDLSGDVISGDGLNDLKATQNDFYTSSGDSFTDLSEEINCSATDLNLVKDYTFDNETDSKTGILISKDNFVINGNGRTIDGAGQARIFNITGNNVTLRNLILVNGNSTSGGAIYVNQTLTLINVTFINNNATGYGGAVMFVNDVTLNCNNCRFIDNYANAGSSLFVKEGELNLLNAEITSKIFNKYAQITCFDKSRLYINNTTFFNCSASYAPAIYLRGANASIYGSRFINLWANITAGAIGGTTVGELEIESCEFINVTSDKNGGAVYIDIIGNGAGNGEVVISNSLFENTSSQFGGAYLQLGGFLEICNTQFINGHATFDGGSVYLSHVETIIENCTFDSNDVDLIEKYLTHGGAIYNDYGDLNITCSNFFNNWAPEGSAIYTYDTSYNIFSSLFENNTNPIYSVFDGDCSLEGNTYINDDNVSTGNTYYATIMIEKGVKLTLINNTIYNGTIPDKFDLRDYGWVSPVRDQGWMGACWTFGMTGALESVLLKATGISADFSENNMQDTMLQYSIYGAPLMEGGMNVVSAAYLLSWLGAFPQSADTYDELGKISPVIHTNEDVHIQDVIFVPNNEIPNGTQLKEAIMKYGSLDVCYFGQSSFNEKNPYYNPDTYAQYINESIKSNHEVSVVGWDDSYPASNFLITPPGDGAWIIKNSWGADWGDNGYLYVSYYDKSFLASNNIFSYAATPIVENDVVYNKNYQYDLLWSGEFISFGQNVSYMTLYTSWGDDLIAAVGTYFNQGGVDYNVEIYVNNELKWTQDGVSPYLGFHTIKLDKYIPIKEGDVFCAVVKSNSMPACSLDGIRPHYTKNLSLMSLDDENWEDCFDEGYVACLKVYTVENDCVVIDNRDISVDVGSGSYFTVKVVTADGHAVGEGVAVNFTINGKTTEAFTDDNGIAKVKITEAPGQYNITTALGNKTYINLVTVRDIAVPNTYISVVSVEGMTLTGILTNYNGTPILDALVSYTLNDGDVLNVTTGDDGSFAIEISYDCIVKMTYAGNEFLNPSSKVFSIKDIKPLRQATEIEVENQFTRYANDFNAGERGAMFYFTLKDGDGNVLANKSVKIGINGVIYSVVTDSKGKAGLQINLAKSTAYTYAIAYLGDDEYNASFAVSKLNLVKKPITITPKKTSYTFTASAKNKYVEATLSTIKNPYGGKMYLSTGKKVTLTINGKTYTATAGKNGAIKFNIGSTTKKGTYKVTIKYAGDATYEAGTSKTITIKLS